MTVIGLVLGVAAVSAVLTGALYRYALVYGVLDVPNARSAHAAPTPRGGGIAIVVALLAGIVVLGLHRTIDSASVIAFAGAGGLVAIVGFLDDHRPLTVPWRLLAHLLAATWGLVWLGGIPSLELVGSRVDLGIGGQVFAVLSLVWLLNLYNFMDGIDGIAGLEAAIVGSIAAVLAWTQSARGDALLSALFAAASLGFLAWNWPPARIFMGDAGSGFLGLVAGLLAIHAGHASPALLWAWVILLGVFVVDASVTLLRRLHRHESAYQAHSDHAYQHAARQCAHRTITLAAGAITVLWLAPIAALATLSRLTGIVGVALAYGPLVWLAIRLKSGAASTQPSAT